MHAFVKGFLMTRSLPTIDELKLQAKRLRQAMTERGAAVTHGAALELVAQQHGARDWNTLSARAHRDQPKPPFFAVGERVRGRYLGQSFEGRVLSLATLPGGDAYKISIHFNEPVDVVTFDSFSAYRSRITAQIDANGVSPRKTSNGQPHLVLEH